ncbi:Zn-dependent exopeptidase [Mytilinidion resinicola]|uniref:Zn-dependent exopeptidase n=1 Tax=Mytilinidion resinicola TaxID=574789 RepID=A0A6A6Y7E8_9PEZI|nr:Zn-dependent exopeptidase [Mytilinidion resinicola]KAF2803727.1 Zn-dependent exopeptidase [Mytilinidion resinicola]
MVDEKHLYDAHEHLPIPTYEEATSSRPSSSQSRLGPSEISDDAERQGLLGLASTSTSRRRNGYHAPSVQSVRSSEDSDDDLDLPEVMAEAEEGALRRDIEEMDFLDAEAAEDGAARRARMRMTLSKRFSSFTTKWKWPAFSFSMPWPNFGWLTDRLPRIPEQYRPGWSVIARLIGLFVIVSLIYLLFVSEVLPVGNNAFGQPFNPEWVRSFAQGSIQKPRIIENLRHITSYDHVAGSEGSLYLGKWIEGRFRAAGMDSIDHDFFHVYLNYPKEGGRRVAIIDPPDMAWEAKLEEDSVYEHPTPEQQQTPVFHGLSKSGNATGPLIYANYGSKEDFKRLADSHIDVTGSIILVRYGGTQTDRGMKVKAAQDAGAVGCLIYSDPQEDGFIKGAPWPNGRWRPRDGVQRGTVALTSWIAGDVLTPGYASTMEADRISKDDNPALVKIPSLPLSWSDAQKLLAALKGHGEKLPEEWVGGVPDIAEWWSGDKTSPKVLLQNFQDESEKQAIYNVMGTFEGIESKKKKIIVGNHRDSWCFGAIDPGSGTAVMLEVIDILGALRATGWRPLRTIEFASWDAEEYNLIGSTEYVESRMDALRADAIAYINVDVGVSGDEIYADGSPLFRHAWLRVLDRVADPVRNKTLREVWDQSGNNLGGLGAGSDYVAFQDMAGCSSIDFGFNGPGYPYHSCYESFELLERFVDPHFNLHKTLAEVWVLLILELAQEPIMPYNMDDYAAAIKGHIDDLDKFARAIGNVDFDVTPLRKASAKFEKNAKKFTGWEDFWYGQVYGTGGFESNTLQVHRLAHNAKMSDFESHLLDLPQGKGDKKPHGIPGREQYKHILFAPDASGSGYDAAFFPFVRDALDARDWKLAQEQLQKSADILSRATDSLLH